MRVAGEVIAAPMPYAAALKRQAPATAVTRVVRFMVRSRYWHACTASKGPILGPALRLPCAVLPVEALRAYFLVPIEVELSLFAMFWRLAFASARALSSSAFACFLQALSSLPFW